MVGRVCIAVVVLLSLGTYRNGDATVVVPDCSGHGNDITFAGTPEYGAACTGTGLGVEGLLNTGTVPANLTQMPPSMSVDGNAIWDGTVGVSGSTIAHKGGDNPDDSGRSWILNIDFDGHLHGVAYYGPSTSLRVDLWDPETFPVNTCTHVALTVSDGGTVALYKNGVVVASESFAGRHLNYAINSDIEFANENNTAILNGVLDDFQLSDIARTSFPVGGFHTIDEHTLALWRFWGVNSECDSDDVPVKPSSWGTVKQMFR